MELRINRNTPEYTWRSKAGRSSVEIGSRKGGGNNFSKIIKMTDYTDGQKGASKEELTIRGIANNNP